MVNSLILILLLLGTIGAHAQSEATAESITFEDGLSLTDENPLTPHALKKNGKFKEQFKIPFAVLVEYYKFAGQGYIIENPNPVPILDIDMDLMTSKSTDNIEFYVSLKKKKAHPTVVINPHTVSSFFVLNPKMYNLFANAPDFVTAKQKVYQAKGFDSKKLTYDSKLIHLEDWKSLNHPPVQDLGEDLTVWDQNYAPIEYSQKDSIFYTEAFQKKVDEVSNTELTFGNKLELLENGQSYIRKLLELDKAKSSVLMAVMSFFCDESSRVMEDKLIEKVKAGIDVKLMVEKVWTKIMMKKCLNRMIKGGVDVVLANDLLKKGDEQALFHDKFMVIDNEKVIMGGANIMASDNISTGTNHMNRDNDVFIEGPIASDATLSFTKLWRKYANKENGDISLYEKQAEDQKKIDVELQVRGPGVYSQKLNDKSARSQGACRFMNQSPDTDKNKLSKVFIEYIQNAESHMSMTNGNTFYFDLPEHKDKERARDTWNKKLYRSIFSSVERGVKLDIIGNGIDGGYGEASNMFKRMYLKNRYQTNPFPQAIYSFLANFMDKAAAKTNQPFLEELAKKKNIRAWTHFQYMHSKKMQFDRLVTVISSYNLDEWSADKSHESAVVCMDDSLNKQMERSFLLDMVNSEPASIRE